MILFFVAFSVYRVNKKPTLNVDTTTTSKYIVIEEKEKYLIVQDDKASYLVYIDSKYYENDILQIKGEINEIEKDLDLYLFEFADYLKNKRVFYQIDKPEITLINRNIKLSEKTITLITSRLENESYSFTKMLLFNDKKADINNYQGLLNINAVHLFVVSGFHINFLFMVIAFIFKKNEMLSIYVSLIICFIYVLLLDFSISATRALICLILLKLFKDFFTRLDAIALSGIAMLIYEPMFVYNYSFILTYIIATCLAMSSKIMENKSKLANAILTSFICIFSILPVQLIMNYKINFISFFSNMILNYVVSVLFILAILGLIISFFNGNIFSFIYKLFFQGINYIDDHTSSLIFGSMKPYMICIYYVLFILILYYIEKEKIKPFIVSFVSMFAFMFILYNRIYFIPYQQVTFLNVYQGDCSIIIDSHGKGVMLIDTGGLKNYDIASKKIVPYLQYQGIKYIDMVVITHDDYDHCGALSSLVSKMPVKEIITDCDIESISLGNLYFENLNMKASTYQESNLQSIVLYGNVCNSNILFMADADYTIENNIMEEYETLNVDILRVGHHGSSTSSGEKFIEFIKPSVGIISVGANNYYGHPTQKVLDILTSNDVLIYRTDLNGSIKISYDYFKSYFIETAK